MPRTNGEYWGPKLARNVARDMETEAELRVQGWLVVRYWEHEAAVAIANDICRLVDEASRITPAPSTPLA
jgi:DNA mismatch endonuclease (patch repair protein)